MSSSKQECVLNIIREHFGPIVQQIAHQLIINGFCTLKSICFFTKQPVHLVKDCLKTLIQHNLVKFRTNSRDQVEYEMLSDNVIPMFRYSRYVLVGSYVDSKIGQYLIEEFLKNGKLSIEDLIEKLIKRLANDSTFLDKYELPKLIYDTFSKFVNQNFIVNADQTKSIPTIDFKKFHSSCKIKKEHEQQINGNENEEETNERPSKRQKTNNSPTTTESAIQLIWYLNNRKFDDYLKCELIANCIKTHYDDVKAGELARIICLNSDNFSAMSRSVIINKALESKVMDTVSEVDDYLRLFDQDLMNRFIYRVENTSDGGRFKVNEYNLFYHLAKETIASFVTDCYGEKSGRIFRLLLSRKYLQQKAVYELAMISVKDAKERLSALFRDGIIKILQYSKAPEYAPMKTSFVATIDLDDLCLLFKNKCFHALHSIVIRRNHEYTSNRSLIEKKALIDSIVENMQGTNEVEPEGLDQTFSTYEKSIISRYEKVVRKSELCELEIEKTLFLIDTYLEIKSNK